MVAGLASLHLIDIRGVEGAENANIVDQIPTTCVFYSHGWAFGGCEPPPRASAAKSNQNFTGYFLALGGLVLGARRDLCAGVRGGRNLARSVSSDGARWAL